MKSRKALNAALLAGAILGSSQDAKCSSYGYIPSGGLEVKLENITQNAPSVNPFVYVGDNEIYIPAQSVGGVTSLGLYSKESLAGVTYEFSQGVSMSHDSNSLPGLNSHTLPNYAIFSVYSADPPVYHNGINSGTEEYAKIFMTGAKERYLQGDLGIGIKMQGLPPADYSDTYFGQVPEPKDAGLFGAIAAAAVGLNHYRKRRK